MLEGRKLLSLFPMKNRPTFSDVVGGLRFFSGLPRLLRYRVTAEKAHAALKDRFEHRQANFLALAKDAIYGFPASPYRKLLQLAGCEFGDLEALVQNEGVEGTLYNLYRKGVYLTVGEAKGRRPVVRGSAKFDVIPGALAKPGVTGALISESGGSRGSRAPVPIDLNLDKIRSADMFLDFEARGGVNWVRAIWAVPGTASLRRVINYTLCGPPLARWFSVVDAGGAGLHPRYLWSARALRLGGLLAGVVLPRQVYVPLHDPLPIAQWMSAILRAGRTPQLYTYASCAVRLCQAAIDSGISLQGAQFVIGGEPTTASRLAVIDRAGATAHVQCGSVETDTLGRGCMSRLVPDDLHLLDDRLVVIQPGNLSTPDLPAQALMITSLFLPMAKVILLNTSLGDQAKIEQRNCGCPMEKLGWTTHFHTIRSFEKLTAGGMTFSDADLVRVLEDRLPAQFGGGPTDYQILDEESPDGKPRVRLLVHPRLGSMDPAQVRQTFLDAIGAGSGVERVMMLVWRDAGLPIVEREAPRVTSGGKILHVHLDRPNRLSANNAD
jgi:hypothetical protein